MIRRIIERRGNVCWGMALIIATSIVWISLSIAVGATLPESKEKALTQDDLVQGQWWIISGLIGLLVIVSQGFILYVVSGIKGNIRKLFEFHETVLTKDRHDEVDHSQLCAVCRNAKLRIDTGGH